MRLLHTKTHQLHEFGDHNRPLYATLSHRWRTEEVTFQDIESGRAPQNASYDKIEDTCRLAASHGFDYVWIDTCCIDKTNSSELSEAINSMYYWYETCTVCYVYLFDVQGEPVARLEDCGAFEEEMEEHHEDDASFEQQSIKLRSHAVAEAVPTDADLDDATLVEFEHSEWFKRGWTLQELIAPREVIFLNRNWKGLCTKNSRSTEISNVTGIPEFILRSGHPADASIAQRMSWASRRVTTRIEDRAYCLMGLFGVHMPMLYGEREQAFIRLQEEILKTTDDYSIFAWKHDGEKSGWAWEFSRGLLAPSVDCFAKSGNIIPDSIEGSLRGTITVNNKGIHIEVLFHKSTMKTHTLLAGLPCVRTNAPYGLSLTPPTLMSETDNRCPTLGTSITLRSPTTKILTGVADKLHHFKYV